MSLMYETEGYEIDWLSTGDKLWEPEQERLGHNVTGGDQLDFRVRVNIEARRLRWHDVEDGVIDGPMSPVLAIKALIQELPLPKVSAYAYSGVLAGYQVLGVEANYKQGRMRLIAVDRGTDVLPVCTYRYWQEASE